MNLDLSRYEFGAECLARMRHELPSDSVYDVGAGSAEMRLAVENQGLIWQGFDLLPRKAEILNWNLDHPCPSAINTAGAVLLLDVVEHLRNPGIGLGHIAEVLLPGGKLILTTPNPRWSRSRIHALLSGVPACFTEADLRLNGHCFTPWPHILEKMLTDAGFVVEEYATLDGRTLWPRLLPLTANYPLRIVHALLNKSIEWSDHSACGMSYAFVAKKVTPAVLGKSRIFEPRLKRMKRADRSCRL